MKLPTNVEKLIDVIKIWKESPRLIYEHEHIESEISEQQFITSLNYIMHALISSYSTKSTKKLILGN